jgi:hypothetical protein
MARKAQYSKKVPGVMAPDSTWREPRYMISALTMPIRVVEERLITDMAVSVLSTFWSKRSTPAAKTFSSLASA